METRTDSFAVADPQATSDEAAVTHSPFSAFADASRLFLFPVYGDRERARAAVAEFLAGWKSHGRPIRAEAALLEGLFLAVALDECEERASGCSVDAMIRAVRRQGVEEEPSTPRERRIRWRAPDGGVRVSTWDGFAALCASGEIDSRTPVFDASISTVGEWRRGALEKPAGESWHRRAFPLRGA